MVGRPNVFGFELCHLFELSSSGIAERKIDNIDSCAIYGKDSLQDVLADVDGFCLTPQPSPYHMTGSSS